MSQNPHSNKNGLIAEMLERIAILETRLNEIENKSSKRYYSIEEMSQLTNYSVNYLYKKIPSLKKDVHYFKPNGGKLIFDESSVEFLIKGRNQSGESIHESRQPVSIDEYFKSLDVK